MLCVGIDVAKRKHDCCIIDSDALKTVESFTFPNSREGFDMLLSKISELGIPKDKIRVGLEATGHYSSNLAHFISEHDLPLNIFNPLLTNRYKQGFSLRYCTDDCVRKSIPNLLSFIVP